MKEPGEITIHSDEGKPIRTAFAVTQARVEHYGDVVEYMVKAEITRCQTEENFTPSPSQIDFLRKELTRYMIIRRDIKTAEKVRIPKSNKLFG